MAFSEKRSCPRREASLFAVFRRLAKNGEAVPQIGYTRDISSGGAYFYTRSQAKNGDSISMKIHLIPQWNGTEIPPPLEAEGEILRVEKKLTLFPPGRAKGVAVRFTQELDISL
jgi:hypothetical protein